MSVVVVGGSSGIGREVAAHYAARGRDVVVTARDADRAAKVCADIGGSTRGVALELARADEIAPALADVGPVEHLVLAAIDRDESTIADYKIAGATYLTLMKLVGYTAVVHALLPRYTPDASIVIFGGQAKDRPYPGSITVSTVNGGVVGMVHALATEVAPVRVNGIHPGIVGDSPYWAAKPPAVLDAIAARTPTGKLATMADIVGAVVFLLENPAVNGENLTVNGGTLLK